MGLDMYLYLEKYQSRLPIKGEDTEGFYPPELKDIQKSHEKIGHLSKMTKYKVGYWRKVNCVHQFFVDRCANGEDDCRPVYVGLEELEELKTRCEKVLKKHALAEDLLPTQEGFFFGSQEYDEYYFHDLQYTLDIINPVIDFLRNENNTSWSCYYEASW